MSRRDVARDVAALIHPLPTDPPDDEEDLAAYHAARDQILIEQAATVEQLRLAADADPNADPVLSTLAAARRDRDRAEQLIRWLIAYAKEFAAPRIRYTLDELATAAGYRPSGVATAYTHHDVADVADKTATWPSPRAEIPDPDPSEVVALLHDMQRRGPETARERVMEVYNLLLDQGWAPYSPQPRDPGTKATKRYVRWTQNWPGGTTVTLYQEPAGYLGASSKISDEDARRFYADYAEPSHDITYVTRRLAELVDRVDRHDAARP